MTTHEIVLQPLGQHIEVNDDDTLLDAAQKAGVGLISLCGGIGSCDTCRVRLITGKLTEPTLSETGEFSSSELAAGWRLACQTHALSDITLEIPPESLSTPQRLHLEGHINLNDIQPAVTAYDILVKAPTLDDLRSDTQRVRDALPTHVTMPLHVIRQIPALLRVQDWQLRVVVHESGQVVTVLPAHMPLIGLAIDIGTTSIAAYLIDLETGKSLGKSGMMNPQIAYGEDVITRMVAINNDPENANVLQQQLIDAINALIEGLCVEAGCEPSQIVDLVVVGNTAIHHFFTRLPVQQLGEAPYVAATSEPIQFAAADVRLNTATNAQVYMPTNIAGYVGADHTAMILAAGVLDTDRTVLALDIGTNTEITLAHRGKLWTCSTASGPAFEGAHIRDGMRAAPGAIERVSCVNGSVQVTTIENQPATGICGSGILDAIAVMRQQNVIDNMGKLNTTHPHVDTYHGISGFVLSPGLSQPIMVTRKDVATVQLAKGAIRAGIDILLETAGVAAESLDQFLIAGAFGTYISVESAVEIGMFPTLPLDRFDQIGNAAGMGAWMLLCNTAYRKQVATLDVNYIELTAYRDFQNKFMEQMYLGADLT